MKVLDIDQNSDEWLEWRKGKITGSKLKDIVTKRGSGRKIGFYELIADRLALTPDDESAMQRGHDLEEEAVQKFTEATGIEVETDCGVWVSDEDENIAISPDAAGKVDDKYRIAVEAKCLSSARHLQAVVENTIPYDHLEQRIQYFIVNEDLETLYFVFYDPRVISKPLHIIPVHRKDVEGDIEFYKQYEKTTLREIDRIVSELAF